MKPMKKGLREQVKSTKQCSKCSRTLLLYKFFKDAAKSDGYYSSCKDCYRERLGHKKRLAREVKKQGVIMRRCTTCNKYKYRSEFYTNPASHDGIHIHCKSCSIDFTKRPKARASAKKRNQKERYDCMVAYSGISPKCACCKESTYEFLSIDHVDNDGAAHRKKLKSSIYRWLRQNNYPDGFQILCMNCNWAKGKYGKCPHQYETNDYKAET